MVQNKNVALLAAAKARSHTNRQALQTEILDLKRWTDKTLAEVQERLADVEEGTNSRSQRDLFSNG